MKLKYLLFLLPLSFLSANEQAIENIAPEKNEQSTYIITHTSNNNNILNTFTPYYIGIGYRYKFDNQAIDANISMPIPLVYKQNNTAMYDISYIRYFDNSYYAMAGLTQEYSSNDLKYYFMSPFIGFGKEFTVYGYKMFAQAKINSFSYFPMLKYRHDDYKWNESNTFDHWKTALFNFAVGYAF
jgi:hypothetical protein